MSAPRYRFRVMTVRIGPLGWMMAFPPTRNVSTFSPYVLMGKLFQRPRTLPPASVAVAE